MKETIQTAAESFLPALWAMSRAMYDHPELGLEEVNSSRMLREWLAEPVSYTHLTLPTIA